MLFFRLLVYINLKTVVMNLKMLILEYLSMKENERVGVFRSSFTIIQMQESMFASMHK